MDTQAQGEMSLDDLERQEELVWELLEMLRPLLEMLDALDAEEEAGAVDPRDEVRQMRVDAMLRVFSAGVERARMLLPELPPLPAYERGRMALSPEEREKLAFVAQALDRAPAECQKACAEAGVDAEALRDAVEGFRRTEVLERVGDAIRALGTEIDVARQRIERRLSMRLTPVRLGDADAKN